MNRVALGVEYDGSRFVGWQSQKDGRSVQAAVEETLSSVANHRVSVVCAGRTDAGVHAWGQVIHFDAQVERSPRSWALGANSQLPKDVSINWAMPVSLDFHARFSAVSRSYRYLIIQRPTRSALERHRACWTYKSLDLDQMQAAAQYLVGKHDFSAFRASACQAKSPKRQVSDLTISRGSHGFVIDIKANAFLQHMVRNIAGMLMKVGCGERSPEWCKEVLESRDRRKGAITAPAGGLYLVNVGYPAPFEIPQSTPVSF